MHAAFCGKTDVTKFLLGAGASIEAKDNVSKRISIFTYICVSVCVFGERRGAGGYSSVTLYDK